MPTEPPSPDPLAERGRIAAEVRALVEGGDLDDAAELAAGSWRRWLEAGDIAGGRQMLALVLDRGDAGPSRARSRALYADGLLAFRAGREDESRARNTEALSVARTAGDRQGEADALVGLSRLALRERDYAKVRTLANDALGLTRGLEPAARGNPLHLLAAGTRLAGEYDAALGLYAESLDLNRRLGNLRMVAGELHNLGHVHLHLGDVEAARLCFEEWFELRTDGDPYDAAMVSLDQAALARAGGDSATASRLLREAESTLAAGGVVLDPDDAFEVEWLRKEVG